MTAKVQEIQIGSLDIMNHDLMILLYRWVPSATPFESDHTIWSCEFLRFERRGAANESQEKAARVLAAIGHWAHAYCSLTQPLPSSTHQVREAEKLRGCSWAISPCSEYAVITCKLRWPGGQVQHSIRSTATMKSLLDPNFLNETDLEYGEINWSLHQENLRPHIPKKMREVFGNWSVRVILSWPPDNPDLDIIETL
jgi:hypothetical protein